MNLYEIQEGIRECVDEETGEVLDVERLEQLQLAKDEKIESLALWLLELRTEVDATKHEMERLRKLCEKRVNKMESIKRYLLQSCDKPFNTGRVSITFRTSESVAIQDLAAVPFELVRTKIEPDKAAIRAILKSGEEVPGATLERKQNMIIG